MDLIRLICVLGVIFGFVEESRCVSGLEIDFNV